MNASISSLQWEIKQLQSATQLSQPEELSRVRREIVEVEALVKAREQGIKDLERLCAMEREVLRDRTKEREQAAAKRVKDREGELERAQNELKAMFKYSSY